ncbi:hypothetical protein ACIQF6_28285 [Kitasatospora sp. NPDC092948]|uniref:hypothetical protein n=1 Tax=Kitasatospora sp. NPDC092948 TaxID=3364088 RepID=UPI0038028EB7
MGSDSRENGLVAPLSVAELAQLVGGRVHDAASDVLVRPVLSADCRTVGGGERHLAVVTGTDDTDARAVLAAAAGAGFGHTELLTSGVGPGLGRFTEALPTGSAVLVKGLGLGPMLLPYLSAHFAARSAKP